MPHLHLAVQSGSTRVLKKMNHRLYEKSAQTWFRLRAAIPGLALSADIIVGFPGETEEDFEDTLSLVKRSWDILLSPSFTSGVQALLRQNTKITHASRVIQEPLTDLRSLWLSREAHDNQVNLNTTLREQFLVSRTSSVTSQIN